MTEEKVATFVDEVKYSMTTTFARLPLFFAFSDGGGGFLDGGGDFLLFFYSLPSNVLRNSPSPTFGDNSSQSSATTEADE